jgi:hypothetical protein
LELLDAQILTAFAMAAFEMTGFKLTERLGSGDRHGGPFQQAPSLQSPPK